MVTIESNHQKQDPQTLGPVPAPEKIREMVIGQVSLNETLHSLHHIVSFPAFHKGQGRGPDSHAQWTDVSGHGTLVASPFQQDAIKESPAITSDSYIASQRLQHASYLVPKRRHNAEEQTTTFDAHRNCTKKEEQ